MNIGKIARVAVSAVVMSVLSCGCRSVITDPPSSVSVVVIGVENSKWAGSCLGARIDSSRMFSFFDQNLRGADIHLLQDGGATKSAVRSAMTKAVSSELAIIFYSGHGGSEPFKGTGPEEEDGRDEFLCLYDTYMKDNDVWDIVSRSKGRVWLIFDCCHSETMYRSVGVTMSSVGDVSALSSGMSMLCWSGCSDEKYSYGTEDGGELTNAFLRKYEKGMTYDRLWKRISSDGILLKHQKPKRTRIGSGFSNRAVPM